MRRLFLALAVLLVVGTIATIVGIVGVLYHYGRDLPEYQQLAEYSPPVSTRIHAGDGRLMAEYSTEHRLFVPVEVIPLQVRQAFLSAEDKNFYRHPGIDILSLARAAVTNVRALTDGRRPVGGSTITQQVAKNFLLSSEVSLARKIREAILAFRIERALDKDEILELYLNEIYLGYGAYGVAAAALGYFNKSLDDLTLEEAAYLAALPKAPNNYHPERRRDAAVARRNWVLGRMLEDGAIDHETAEVAAAKPLVVRSRDVTEYVTASWFAEEVRREIAQRFGESALYEGGLSVRTSLDPRLQEVADRALREGLREYDRRHGWRGPIAGLDPDRSFTEQLRELPRPRGLVDGMRLAAVTRIEGDVEVVFADDETGVMPFSSMTWARPARPGQGVGAEPSRASQVVSVGDVIAVESRADGRFSLSQIPAVDGGLVALDPHTGRVLAMTGGWSPDRSEFNRATQAWRQPGSAFKPFVYLAALESGLTPATLVLDAPFELEQGGGLEIWRPTNYTGRFYGPSPMRLGLEMSRNLMTVRLADAVGMQQVEEVTRRFGIIDDMPPVLSMALGAGETTLLRLTTAYAMLVNGARRIEPTLIDRVQDRNGHTLFRHDRRECENCSGRATAAGNVPLPPDRREQVADPASAYQVVSMLQGVVEHGTGRAVRRQGRPLAGKTGTTNESRDAWFVGFSSNLAVGVYIGFDRPRPLGFRETGGRVAAPIFGAFMDDALEYYPAVPFRVPPGIRLSRVSRMTGLPPVSGDPDVVLEAFKPGSQPQRLGPVVGGQLADTSGERLPLPPTATLPSGEPETPRDRLRGIY